MCVDIADRCRCLGCRGQAEVVHSLFRVSFSSASSRLLLSFSFSNSVSRLFLSGAAGNHYCGDQTALCSFGRGGRGWEAHDAEWRPRGVRSWAACAAGQLGARVRRFRPSPDFARLPRLLPSSSCSPPPELAGHQNSDIATEDDEPERDTDLRRGGGQPAARRQRLRSSGSVSERKLPV